MDYSDQPAPEQLALQGKELEALEKTQGIWQSVKANKASLLFMLAAYSCAAVYGYDTIANGATLAVPAFELYFGHYDAALKELYLDSIWTSLWSSMTNVGSILGSAIAGPVSQKFGRRYAGMAFGAVTTVGVVVQYTSTAKGTLLAGKMINGFAVGGLLAVGTTYASEISPPRLRGILLGGLAFFIIAMQCIGLGVVRSFVPDTRPSAFRTVFALQWVVGALPIICFLFVPESPTYLVMKGRRAAAHSSLSRLYGKDNSIDARLAHLQAGILRELQKDASTDASYLDCFKGTDLKRTLTVCLLMFGNGLIGTAFLTQNIYFITLAGLPVIHAFDINIAGFGLALIIMPLTWLFGDRIGRRPLYLVGVIGNILGLATVGGLGYATSKSGPVWAIAVLMNLLIVWQQPTNSMVTWSMSPELSSYRLRQHTQSISIMVQAFTSWLFAFVTPYMYNVGAGSGNLGAKTGFVYMGSSILLLFVAYFWIPETKGLTTEEIDYLYEKRVSPRRFGSVKVLGPRAEDKVELKSCSQKSVGTEI